MSIFTKGPTSSDDVLAYIEGKTYDTTNNEDKIEVF